MLLKGEELPVKSKLSTIHPFLDSQGTLRVGGRLQNSSHPYDVKHPIILPGSHKVTELLLRELHLRNLHAGPTLLTATVNQQYWVIGLQAAVRQVVQGCARCVRLKRRTASQLMGSLSVPRVIGTRAFTHVGVQGVDKINYAGPVKMHASCVRGVKTTILAQVKACLNSRPLCPLSSNPDSYKALTPGHFLVGQPTILISEPGLQHVPINRLDKWQLVQRKSTEIRNRWRSKYLTHLQPRTKWRTTETNVREDQLVLVKNDNASPTQWELARILNLHPDSTGVVRTVILRRGQAEYLRPVQKICVLPTD